MEELPQSTSGSTNASSTSSSCDSSAGGADTALADPCLNSALGAVSHTGEACGVANGCSMCSCGASASASGG